MRRPLTLSILLVCLLALPPSASAVVTGSGTGNLVSLASDSDPDTIELACIAGQAHGAGEDLLPCAEVETLSVAAGGGEDVVELANVNATEFPALNQIEIHVGEDGEDDVVNGTALGDDVHADPADTVHGNQGNDSLDKGGLVTGDAGDDLITHPSEAAEGGPGDDRFEDPEQFGPFIGGSGNDTFVFDLPTTVSANLSFALENSGFEISSGAVSVPYFWNSIDRVQLFLLNGGTQTVDAGKYQGILEAHGRGGPDILIGGPNEDFLFGGPGNDDLTGGPGFDWVDGGPEADQLRLRDGEPDRGICGEGGDSAIADAADVLAGCESVDLPAAALPTATPPATPTAGGKPALDQPPETRGLKGPKKVVQGKIASFKFASSERGSTFKCRIDKGPLKTCASPYKASTAKLAPGKSHTFSVFAIDPAGNADKTPATLRFKVEPKPGS